MLAGGGQVMEVLTSVNWARVRGCRPNDGGGRGFPSNGRMSPAPSDALSDNNMACLCKHFAWHRGKE